MKKSTAITLTLVVATIAVAAPILFAINEAQKQGFEAETAHALAYARDVMRRSDGTADQVVNGIAQFEKAALADPCSEQGIAIMRQIDLASSYIQAFGRVVGDRLICSSLGVQGELSLGPVDLVTSKGAAIRNQVKLPFIPDTVFVVLERNGYAAVIHKDLPIDATTSESDVALAIFSLEKSEPISAKGPVNPQWMERLNNQSQVTFSDGTYVVAIVKSERYLSAAVAAVPITYLQTRTYELAKGLVPIGILASLVLAFAIIYMARLQLALPNAIKTALKRDEFFLAYQPIVNLHTREWIGVEALIRWRRPVGEVVYPDVFIPVAESSGLMERITERVIRLVARDIGTVFQTHPHFHVSINLSSADLHSNRTAKLLNCFLDETGARPENLIVEATERGFLHVNLAKAVTSEIRANGIGVAIDDFGTGYSSLSYLQTFELDFLKIDKSFVETIETEAPTSQVVSHIIGMAKGLNLEMIAEGVETETQAQFLRNHGVQYGQGWLFGKPMSFAQIMEQLIRADEPKAEI
jgi:sensor c-di-GMP phosphodiesterase-like protein